jgi:two-component system nitrate/nitrite response regulator NarL
MLNTHKTASSLVKILIADDHQKLRESMRSILRLEASFGVVAEAKDGLEAIELCRLHRPDLVLMDKSMPRMNGLEATRLLKEELPETKVLIVSLDPLSHSEVLRWGAEGYVSKIAPVDEQLEAMREVLR